MNLTEEGSLPGIVLLIDTGFVRWLSVIECEQVGSITGETAEQCKKYVQSTINEKNPQNIIKIINRYR